MEAASIIEMLIHGLLLGGLYGVLTLGLSLIFGVLDIINLAHGAFIMLGAYMAYTMFTATGLNPLASIAVAFPLGMLIGVLTYRYIVRRVIGAPHLTWILLFFGVMIFMEQAAYNIWGAEYKGVPFSLPTMKVGDVAIPVSYIVGFATAMIIAIGLYLLLHKTRIGKAIRAVSQDREAAALMGIDVDKIMGLAFALGIAITMASACVLIIVQPTIYPLMGHHWMDLAFCIAVLGGMGSPTGALLGGFIFGLIETAALRLGLIPEAILAPVVPFVILIITLLVRPQGLLGQR